jgi:hypothetical protein
MIKKLFTILFISMLAISANAQKQVFDIASFVAPKGWQQLDSNGMVILHDYKTSNNLTSFCQIVLFPSRESSGNIVKDFQEEWNSKVTVPTGHKTTPTTESKKTPDGWNVTTGVASITQSGLTYARMLVTATGFGKTMTVLVNTAGSDYTSAIETFFNDFDLNSKAVTNKTPIMNTSFTMNDYLFTVPDGWQLRKKSGHIEIQNMQSGCLIQIFEPQAGSGDLLKDADAMLQQMYPQGWQPQKSGKDKYTITKGYLPKGLEYCMIEASMSRNQSGTYEIQDGAALVIRAGNQNIMIAVRHAAGMLGHLDCVNKYETWKRFFNSFTVNGASRSTSNSAEDLKRIVGVWKISTNGVAAGEYVFAANGHFQLGGAIGSSTTTTDYNYEYLRLTSYNFEGNGTFTISGDKIIFNNRGDSNPETVSYRFEQVDHGGTGWKDRLCLLKKDQRGDYESCYERDK